MGDFNDEPSNSSMSKHLGISCTPSTSHSYQLSNAFCQFQKEGKVSYTYRQNWNMLDQIMISDNLLRDSSRLHFISGSAEIKNENWIHQYAHI
jgi:hypothetical protein